MDAAAGSDRRVESSRSRTYIRPELRAELDHLDLSGRATISDANVIGAGAFGDISKASCTVLDGRVITVAVKRLRFYLREDIDLIFEKEIYVWSKLDHTNVLSLFGFAIEESSGYPLLISEWMVNGSSWNYVRKNNDCNLIRLATGIAEGLAYLHAKNIIHSDIKPDNIVVTDSGDARICDFGGSRIAAASKSLAKPSTGIRGTMRYLAFELVALSDQYQSHTKESDIWAFGMTIFALIAREHPYALLGDTQVPKAITNREVPSFQFWTARSPEEKAIFRNICHLCWDHEPKSRAAMTFIAASLRDSERHINTSRQLTEDSSEREVDDQPKAASSSTDTKFDARIIVDGIRGIKISENGDSYNPLVKLSSKLCAIDRCTKAQSEVYQYLHAVMSLSSSLYEVFTEGFTADEKLTHLMHAMGDVYDRILLFLTSCDESRIQDQTIIRALQQTIECCLFVKQYSRKRFEERVSGTSNGRKMAQFISFFVSFKEALEEEPGSLPAFVSSRVSYDIDEQVLRRRLDPRESDMEDQRVCLLGTRVEIQKQIIEWTLSESKQNILWLHGVAGSGKSTVIASISEHLRCVYRLGAFLKFKRGTSDPTSVIRTIAFKLALFDSTIGSLILDETDRDKDIANASLATQFGKLIREPLTAAASAQQGPIVIVLDALDECGTPKTRKSLLLLLQNEVKRLPLNLKFIVTSRQEKDINITFSSQSHSESVTPFELDYTSEHSCQDVQLYLTHEIDAILEDEGIPVDESIGKQLSIIGKTAAGLFVWASTIIRMVAEHDSPAEKLDELASGSLSFSSIDQLYATVLSCSGITWSDKTSKARFQRVIGIILLSKAPLTESTVDAILGPSIGKCHATLSRLRSVIDYKPGEHIRLFHTSFSDYLMSSDIMEDWFIDISAQETFLAMRCFEIMKNELRFNICDFKSSYIRNNDDSSLKDRINERISAYTSYACSFWSHHLCDAPFEHALAQELSTFLYRYLLYWLEVLSILKKVSMAGPALLSAMKWNENHNVEVTLFLRDARRLISIFALPISQSVPHIYLSMLPVTAVDSKVSAHYLQFTSSLVRVSRKGVRYQSPLLELLDARTDSPSPVRVAQSKIKQQSPPPVLQKIGEIQYDNFDPPVCFSSDGSLIASGSADGAVTIWNADKGEFASRTFNAYVGRFVMSIVFSPDGTRIAVGGHSVTVLDVESGRILVGPFKDQDTEFAAFSRNGKRFISKASGRGLIKIWDMESVKVISELSVGHEGWIGHVACSADGHFIVSESGVGSIYVWEAESGRLVDEALLGHTDRIKSLTFSPDVKYVVSGSYDSTIRILEVGKGEVNYSPLIGHSEVVLSVAYSSDGTRIVSGSADRSVRIWNSQNGQFVSGPFIGHIYEVTSVAFSPDGTRVVSGSNDKTLRIWDAESGNIDSSIAVVHASFVDGVKFSLDGTCIISNDGTTWRVEDGIVVSKGNRQRELRPLAITEGMGFSLTNSTVWWDACIGWATSWVGNTDCPSCIIVSPNGKRVAFGSRDGSIRIWDKEHDQLVCRPFGGYGWVNTLAFSPGDTHIVSGSYNTIEVFDTETGALIFGPLTGHTNHVNSVAYSSDGNHIASGSNDKTVRLWDLAAGRSKVFIGHRSQVVSVSFSLDGSHIVSSSNDYEIRVWNAEGNSDADVLQCTLGMDGWVRGNHGELLLWVPYDLRSTLSFFPNTAVLNNEDGFSISLDFSNSVHGERWKGCFHFL